MRILVYILCIISNILNVIALSKFIFDESRNGSNSNNISNVNRILLGTFEYYLNQLNTYTRKSNPSNNHHNKTDYTLIIGCSTLIGSKLAYVFATSYKENHILCLDNISAYYPVELKYSRLKHFIEPYISENMKGNICNRSFRSDIFDSYIFSYIIYLEPLPTKTLSSPKCLTSKQHNEFENVQCFYDLLEQIALSKQKSSKSPILVYMKTSDTTINQIQNYNLNKSLSFDINKSIMKCGGNCSWDSNAVNTTPAIQLLANVYYYLKGIQSLAFENQLNEIYGPFASSSLQVIKYNELNNDTNIIPYSMKDNNLPCDTREIIGDYQNPIYVDDYVNAILFMIKRKYTNKLPYNTVLKFRTTNTINSQTSKNISYYINYWSNNNNKPKLIHNDYRYLIVRKSFNYLPDEQGFIPRHIGYDQGAKFTVDWYRSYMRKLWDCTSECHAGNLCSRSGWSNAMQRSKSLTNGCTVVLYVVSLYESARNLSPTQSSPLCSIAFINKASPLYRSYKTRYGNWTLVAVDTSSSAINSRKFSRVPKLSPGQFFASSVHFAIYIDSKLIFRKSNLESVLPHTRKKKEINGTVISKKSLLTVIRHPKSKNIFQEATAILKAKASYREGVTLTPNELINQVHYYRKYSELYGINYDNVFEGALLIHALKSRMASDLRCMWYEEYMLWSDRDQISAGFVLSKFHALKYHSYETEQIQQKTLRKIDWIPIYKENDNSSETSYVHILNKDFYWGNSKSFANVLRRKNVEPWHY